MDKYLRKLARSAYWQNIYCASKECNGIHLFENISNFSGLQIRFLHLLQVYDLLFSELARHEDTLLTQAVILDDDRCDAYLVYRNKKNDFMWKKLRKEEKMNEIKHRHPNNHKSGKTNLIEVDLRRE